MSETITLLQISMEANVCSVGRLEQQIGDIALAKGWKSYMTYSRGYEPGASETIKVGNKLDVYWHVLMTRIFDGHGLYSTIPTKNLIKTIKKLKPDIIQLHQVHGYYLNIKLLFNFLREYNVPVIWTFHDCWPFTGHCAHFVPANCTKWQTQCHRCPLIHEYPKSYIDKSERNFKLKKDLFTSLKNLHIVTVSKWLESIVRQSFFKDYDIRTIYNGVDTKIFRYIPADRLRIQLKLEGKRVLVAAATTWSEQKGIKDYIKLATLLPKDVVIVLVGLAKEDAVDFPSNIIAVPKTNSMDELAAYYSLADIVLNLSHAESFGLTTIEGMSCGTPGIVYETTASPELISPETGMVVSMNNIEGVSNAVQTILDKGNSYYWDKCRARVLEFFDQNKQYVKYIDLYERVLKNNLQLN